MFVELLPLLAKRSLAITMCAITGPDATSDTDVRLTIQPKPTDKAEKVPGPYEASGPAAEVDARFVSEIADYTKTVMAFYSSLEAVKASTEATLKEVKDDAAKKVAEAKKTGKVGTSAVKPTPAPAKPEPVKAPEPPSLFDAVPAPAPVAAVTPAPAPAAVVAEPVAASDDDDDTSDTDSCCAVSDDDEEEDEEEEATAVTEQVAVYATASGDAPEAQSSMFAKPSWENEEEILKEAFHGDQNRLIAA